MPQKYNLPVECALYILVDNLAACPIYAEPSDAVTGHRLQNNVGPDADPLLAGELEAAIGEINAPEPGGASGSPVPRRRWRSRRANAHARA
jgi:hypothetical protein